MGEMNLPIKSIEQYVKKYYPSCSVSVFIVRKEVFYEFQRRASSLRDELEERSSCYPGRKK